LLAGRLAEVPDDQEVAANLFLAIRGVVATGQEEPAFGALSTWVEKQPRAYAWAAVAYAQLLDDAVANARASLQRALECEARMPPLFHYVNAAVHAREGEHEAARKAWRSFLEAQPEGPLAESVRAGWVVLEDRKLVGAGLGYTYPAFSPDGRLLLCSAWKQDGVHLVLFDPATGKERTIVRAGEGQQLHRPVWSADGREFFYERVIPQKGEWPLRTLMRAPVRDNAEGQPVAAKPSGCGSPFLTADGKTLCFEGNEGEVWTLPVAGGEPQFRFNTGGTFRFFRSASPSLTCDGKYVILSGIAPQDGAVARVPTDNPTKPGLIAFTEKRLFAWGTLSPDERTYATSIGTKEGEGFWDVCVVDVGANTKPQKIAWGRPEWNYRPVWSPDGTRIVYVGRNVDLRVATLGGLPQRSLRLTVAPTDKGATATLTCAGKEATTVTATYQLFDAASAEVASGGLTEQPLPLKPGEVVEFALPTRVAAARTMKATVVAQTGERAVALAALAAP
jgi:hypothetical protein